MRRVYDKKDCIQPWLSYPGNKYRLLPLLLALVPSGVDRFVDLFGGTGVVGVNACLLRGAKSLVYNDYEHDLASVIDYMHSTPPNKIIAEQEALCIEYFGDSCPALTEENKDAWLRLRSDYNSSRVPALVSAGYYIGKQYYKNRVNSTHHRPPRPKYHREGDADVPAGAVLEEDYLLGDVGRFILLARTSRFCQPNYNNKGEYNGTVNFDSPGRALTLSKVDRLYRFASAVYSIGGLEVFSCSAPSAFVPLMSTPRSRSEREQHMFNALISRLTSSDLVYIDPPYLNSDAAYNSTWGHRMEVLLLASCEVLADRGVPFLLSNNLHYNDSILREWSRCFTVFGANGSYTAMGNEAGRGLKCEVFVSNLPIYTSRTPLPCGLVRVPKKSDPVDFLASHFGSSA